MKSRQKNIRQLAALVTVLLAARFSLFGAQKTADRPWETKDWTQWTSQDLDAMGESPWSQTTQSGGIPSPNSRFETTGFGSGVQLRSALPIRQGILRNLQLTNHYDTMKPDKKKAFDQAHLHDVDPIDQVKVYIVNYSMEPPPIGTIGIDKINGPQPARQAALRLGDGNLVLPIQTNSVKYTYIIMNEFTNQYEYTFPRTVAGKPLYSADDSFLTVELGAPLVMDKKTHQPVQQDFQFCGKRYVFKISDLMYKGNLEY